MRWYEIFERAPESTAFGLAKKAYQSLSWKAKAAIDAWETANWTGGPLENHFKANDEVAQEIETAFTPVRDSLPDTVTLYRGIIKDGDYKGWQNAILQSWTSDRETAEIFAGLRSTQNRRSFEYPEVSDEEIDAAVAKYEKTGFLKFQNKYYVRNKEHPQYYNIYNSGKSLITDGDDLRRDLTRDQEWNRKLNQERQSKAEIFKEEIPKDRIIWLTNSVDCKEFIVKR